MWLSRLYIIFVGFILTLTTGFGIAAFYPEPQRPFSQIYLEKPYTAESCFKTPEAAQSAECLKLQAEREQANLKYQEVEQTYQNQSAIHTRTTVFFGIAIGALFTIISLTQIKKSKLIAHGLILAGVLTMILTKLTVMIASFGAGVTATETTNLISYAEFGILLVLSAVVLIVGKQNLQESQ